MGTKPSIASTANLIACVVLAVLSAFAVAVTILLGPFGLVLLGLATVLVCTKFALDEHAPTWGAQAFAATMERGGSPEERAAATEARRAALAPARFYRWCGILLLAAGCGGVAWQYWH